MCHVNGDAETPQTGGWTDGASSESGLLIDGYPDLTGRTFRPTIL
jgi:hypothetical protein